ncbi:MAG: VTT domain-containing protein [Candidatus Paceibacterota bacterium]|jgi:membrane protein DedA with SNARE-associated domain
MEQTIALILQYKYAILFPLSIIEGPILAVLGGFLVSIGILDFVIVYLIIIAGDIIGDSIAYTVGRFGSEHFLKRFGKLFRITEERLLKAKEFFNLHRKKSLVMSKLVHGIGVSGLITAGSLKIPYQKFFSVCLLTSIVQSLVLTLVGLFFGHAYVQIGKYFDYFAATTIIVGIIVVIIILLRKRLRWKTPNQEN